MSPTVTGDGESDDIEAGAEAASFETFLQDAARAAAPTVAPSGLAPGSLILGRFRLEKSLGEGGMGVVWEAVHAVTRKPVALKFLKHRGTDDPRAVKRFLREARAACAVRHPSVVEVHDVLELEDGSPVMVMDLLTGETLAQRLAREHVLSLPDLARIMVHVCSAVGCAHTLGIVHRDLKPENIFLASSGSAVDVKVLDFGIAKLTASEGDAAHTGVTTGTGAILGTPFYMAPEQLFGEKDVDHRADIWALGVILYEALAGSRPTPGANMGQILKVVMTDAIVPLREKAPHLPERMLDLVSRMLSRDRAARPADAREVLAVLADYTNEAFVVVSAPSTAAHESVSTPPNVDSDTARASTLAAGKGLAVSDPPSGGAAQPRRASRARVMVGVAFVGLAALGVVSLRGRWMATPRAPAVTPLATAVPTAAATMVFPPAPSVEPEKAETTAPSSQATASTAGLRPPGAPSGARARAGGPPRSAPSSPPPKSVADPASYQ